MTADKLTREQILAMRPGRELDCLIGEKFFGFTGIGYYGPNPNNEHWQHIESVRYDSPEDAQEAYRSFCEKNHKGNPIGFMEPDDEANFEYPTYWKDGWGPMIIPSFSDDISNAFELINHMAARGYWVQCRNGFIGQTDSCFAGFTPHNTSEWNGTPDNWTEAKTLPHAICLAALLTTLEDS